MFRSFWSAIFFGLVSLGLVSILSASTARADDGCNIGDIVPAYNSYVYSTLPFCNGEAVLVPSTPGAPYGYTIPGNTPFVNGQPQITPYSNISTYTPQQAAEQRAQGNLSATSNAYNQYGGFTPPGQTATMETSPSYIISPR